MIRTILVTFYPRTPKDELFERIVCPVALAVGETFVPVQAIGGDGV